MLHSSDIRNAIRIITAYTEDISRVAAPIIARLEGEADRLERQELEDLKMYLAAQKEITNFRIRGEIISLREEKKKVAAAARERRQRKVEEATTANGSSNSNSSRSSDSGEKKKERKSMRGFVSSVPVPMSMFDMEGKGG